MSRAALLGLFVAACGGSSPGSGTGTLFAEALIEARADSTKVRVDLLLRGEPVRGANVVVTDEDTTALHTLEDKKGGRYELVLNGYVRTLSLKVTSGNDELDGRLVGPAPFVVTRPPNNAIVRRGESEVLSVEWEAEDPADRVEIRAQGAEPISIAGDPFSYDLPIGAIANGDQKLRVARETEIHLEGGVSGSRMVSRSEVDNRFTLE
ncbi:MAG: hypothetical protein HYV07_25955 [Deltaproteobacteria bacterium]|nr:hypothetical protein [Deltaproteobacteria bacterium]